MDYSNYSITGDISKADAWLAYSDQESVVKEWIIPNKIYPLIKLKDNSTDEEEIYILSEDGTLSLYYLCHKGDYIKVN